ncbi:hypothetical protein V6N11_004585 [Hibiscus sabdariffa]|uniref:Bulb-type lectin domain-containing protein n=1 Tax=Hibiscus sabdariffa TaxID=183260 RepID=A0ABR2SGN3_9ROSI
MFPSRFKPMDFDLKQVMYVIIFQYCLFSGSYHASAADSLAPTQSIRNGTTLLSSAQTFELGFFSPGQSNKFYLGIWYKRFPDTVVWVGNREKPVIGSHAFLNISTTGNLFIFDGQNTIIWSTNPSRPPKNPVAQLLDSGNLVLKDADADEDTESYLWESFDFPSDTQLAGMKIGRNFKTGTNRYLTARKGVNDPSPGDFTYGVDDNGSPQFVVHEGTEKRFRTGPWNGIKFNGHPAQISPIIHHVNVFNTEEAYDMFEVIDKSFISRTTINESGLVQRLVLYENASEWTIMYTLQNDLCNDYARCGPNGICKINQRPICECLEGFVPRSEGEWQAKMDRYKQELLDRFVFVTKSSEDVATDTLKNFDWDAEAAIDYYFDNMDTPDDALIGELYDKYKGNLFFPQFCSLNEFGPLDYLP